LTSQIDSLNQVTKESSQSLKQDVSLFEQ